MNTVYSLCFLIQTVHPIATSTFIDNSLITSSVAYEQNNISYQKIRIDATSMTTPEFIELHELGLNSNIAAVQLIHLNQTDWDLIKEIEILVCAYNDVSFGDYVLQTRLDPQFLECGRGAWCRTFYVNIGTNDFRIYAVDCNMSTPTISSPTDCYLAGLWTVNVYDYEENHSNFLQLMFWKKNRSCNCINCNGTKLFCQNIGDSDSWSECDIYECDTSEYIPGACPEPVIFNLTDLQCGDVYGSLDESEWHSYRYFVNSTTMYSYLIFSTCLSDIDTVLRVRQNGYHTIHDWIDDDTCESNEQFILHPLYDYDSSIINIDIKSFGSGGDYHLNILCSDTAPPTTTTNYDYYVHETNQDPFDWNSYVIESTNITLNCDDNWTRMLSYDVNNTYTVHVYEFPVDASDYFAVFFSTQGTINTRLEARDINWNRIVQSYFNNDYWYDRELDIYNDQLVVNWIDNYDGSSIYVMVGFWESGNYTLSVNCQDQSIAQDISCGDIIFGNTLNSYGINYRFVNPSKQTLIFDICSVSDEIELILYDSNWRSPHNQFFKSELSDGGWRQNISNCAHWEEDYEFDAGIYYLRIENPAAFEFSVICDEPYVFPNPRTSDLIGNNCNYIQSSPEEHIWPTDECFGFFGLDDINDTMFLYSLQFVCDENGYVWQNWYFDTMACDTDTNKSWAYHGSELYSYNCNAMDSCPSIQIHQFEERGAMEGGAFLIDECLVVGTEGGFESIKNVCFDGGIVEMHYVGFDCAETVGLKEYNYRNVTYYNESVIDGKYWIFGPCPTANTPQTTNVITTTAAFDTTDTDSNTTGIRTTDTKSDTTQTTEWYSTAHPTESQSTAQETTEDQLVSENVEVSMYYTNYPFVFIVCNLWALLYQ